MHLKAIKEKARAMDIAPGSMNKKELIRSIQEKEGYQPCFKTNPAFCDQFDCCWRSDCKPGEVIAMS